MPLYKTLKLDADTQILVWKIAESFEELSQKVILSEYSQNRLNGMKSEMHRCAFLAVRMLLHTSGISDFDLHYDSFGKPHLNDSRYISITHSHHFAAIILSKKPVGIDIELQREKIKKIANKFIGTEEAKHLENTNDFDFIKKLTVKWGAKEAIFKIKNEKGISFKDHIKVFPFEISDQETTALLDFKEAKEWFQIYFEAFENFTLVYAF